MASAETIKYSMDHPKCYCPKYRHMFRDRKRAWLQDLVGVPVEASGTNPREDIKKKNKEMWSAGLWNNALQALTDYMSQGGEK